MATTGTLNEPIYYSDAYGWCVGHEGWWFYLNRDWDITSTQEPPTGRWGLLGRGWFVTEVLMEYVKLITDMDHSCENPDAMWPITLVQTAEKIDLLSKILANFMGKEHQVNVLNHKRQWSVGKVPGKDELTCGWEHGRVFMYDHGGSELALCVGLISSPGSTNEGNSQEPFCLFQAFYGQDFKASVHDKWQCSWAQFQQDLCAAVKHYAPKTLHGFKKTSTSLLSQHGHDFARLFIDAIIYEDNKKMQKNEQNRSSKEASYRRQVSELEAEKHEFENMFSKQVQDTNRCKSDLADAKQEVTNLREELSEYRATLGSLSSGLSNVNLGENASLPPVYEILNIYDKLVNTIGRLYDDITGNSDSNVQLIFAVSLSAILHKMWRTAYHRYIGLVKDLCGCDKLAKLSTASTNDCDMHCRKHWENLFMPLVDDLIVMPTVQKNMPRRGTRGISSPQLQVADAAVSATEHKNDCDANLKVCNEPNVLNNNYPEASGSSQGTPAPQGVDLATHGDSKPEDGGKVESEDPQVHDKPEDCISERQEVVETPQEAPAPQGVDLATHGDSKPEDGGKVESEDPQVHDKPEDCISERQEVVETPQEAPAGRDKEILTIATGNSGNGEDSSFRHAKHPTSCKKAPAFEPISEFTDEGFSKSMAWFLNMNPKAEGAFKRLWKVVVCLFLQHPACVFQFMKDVTAGFESEIYKAIDDDDLQEGERVVVVLPPIRTCPKSMLVTEIGEKGCDASKWIILRKGIADYLYTE